MSAIHGVASYFVPGLGQMIGGEGKEGAKCLGRSMACGIVGAAAGLGVNAIAVGKGMFGQDIKDVFVGVIKDKAKPQMVDKLKKFASNSKAVNGSLIALGAVMLGAATLALVNRIKSIVDASKIEKEK